MYLAIYGSALCSHLTYRREAQNITHQLTTSALIQALPMNLAHANLITTLKISFSLARPNFSSSSLHVLSMGHNMSSGGVSRAGVPMPKVWIPR